MRDRMTRLNAAVVVPLLVILAITAPKLVPFVFGSYWKLATAPTQILAFAGIATTLTYCATPFLLASGHPKAVFKFNVATFLVYGGGILVAVSHGLQAVCVAVAITNLLAMLGSYVLMQRLTDVPLRRIWQDSAPAMVSGAALAAVALPLMAALSGRGLPAYVLLAVVGAVGAATYLVTLRFLFRDAFSDLLLIMRSLLPTRRRPHRPSGRETGRAPQRRRLALAVGLPLVAFAIAYGVRTVTVTPLARVVSARAASPQPATKRAGVGELLALAPFHSPASLSVPARPRVSGNAAKSPAVTHTGPTSAPTASGVAPSQASPPPIGFGGGTGPATVTPAPAPPPASGTGVPPSGGTTGSRTGRGAPSSGPASTQSTPARGTGTSSGGG